MVRTRDGRPVRGLTADDFIVEERGQRYNVEVSQPLIKLGPVKNLPSTQPTTASTGEPASSEQQALATVLRPTERATNARTHVLLMLPPMQAGARSYMLQSAIKHLQHVTDSGWEISLIDPSRSITPPTRNVAAIIDLLKRLQKEPARPQFGNGWIMAARRVIREQSVLAGSLRDCPRV
jgi:hypothetical protein